jgi:uncharacterized membrane protein YqjE
MGWCFLILLLIKIGFIIFYVKDAYEALAKTDLEEKKNFIFEESVIRFTALLIFFVLNTVVFMILMFFLKNYQNYEYQKTKKNLLFYSLCVSFWIVVNIIYSSL